MKEEEEEVEEEEEEEGNDNANLSSTVGMRCEGMSERRRVQLLTAAQTTPSFLQVRKSDSHSCITSSTSWGERRRKRRRWRRKRWKWMRKRGWRRPR